MTLQDLFRAPAFDERHPSHQPWALHIVLWSTTVVVIVIELLHMITLPENTGRWAGMIVFVLVLNLLLIALNHSGRTQIACILCAFAYWLLITVLIAGEGTLRAPEAPAYLLITFTAGVLLGTRGGVIVGIACALTISVFVLLERHGLTHTVVKHTTVTYWYTQIFYISMILSLQWLANHSIQRALTVARRELEQRKQAEKANAELTRDLERRVGERTAELKSANRELEAFSYSVSHDLRGPLRTIDGYSTILLDEYRGQLSGEAGFLLDQIGASARRMGRLINDLLAFSQVGRMPLIPSDINVQSLVDGIIAELRQQEPQREVKWEASTLLPCRGEPSLIRQVFVNLLGNALKFTRERTPAVIEITSHAQNGEVRYAVRDNGAGFDMQFAKKLFAPFERLHKAGEFEGSGIGLSIVQRIIQRHGGNIWAESVPNRGTTFFFTLPVPGFGKA